MSEKSIYECRHEVQIGPGQTVCEAHSCQCLMSRSFWQFVTPIDPDPYPDYGQTETASEGFDDYDALAIGLADLFGGAT